MYHGSFRQNKFRSRSGFQRFNRKPNWGAQKIDATQYVNNTTNQVVPEKEVVIINKFDDFALDPRIKANIKSHGYTTPTPIQDKTIPYILGGQDVVGIANTGTGKTAAFLLPLINKILNNRMEKILIIIPTRELAVQVSDELKAFSKDLKIFSLLCIGGVKPYHQIIGLRRNPNVIIGTPGRLKDLINRRVLNLSEFRNIVLDEVDRMVDIGFIHDIKYIIALLPKERQSLFFSATVSPQINNIIQHFLRNPITVSVKTQEVARQIEQEIIRVKNRNDRFDMLTIMLNKKEFSKVLVFGRTKWGVEKLSRALQTKGFNAASIHGNKSQGQRLRVLNQFKQNQLHILVATDVAARGLDIEDVSHVINYDEPSTYTDYVHRIGRTGRAQKSGKALTFVG